MDTGSFHHLINGLIMRWVRHDEVVVALRYVSSPGLRLYLALCTPSSRYQIRHAGVKGHIRLREDLIVDTF